jgi:hypothetical protein
MSKANPNLLFSLHSKAKVSLDVAAWDYTQRYPNDKNDIKSGLLDDSIPASAGAVGGRAGILPNGGPDFHADVSASGDLTASLFVHIHIHLCPIPVLDKLTSSSTGGRPLSLVSCSTRDLELLLLR